jgi:hypothetical protein
MPPPTPPSSPPFFLNEAFWTMIAAILALVFGVFGSLILRWWAQRFAAKLTIGFDKLPNYSGVLGGAFHARVPVFNQTGKEAAREIEVFLQDINLEYSPQPFTKPSYLPLRLRWTHGSDPVCDRIAGGAYRLLDLAALSTDPANQQIVLSFATERNIPARLFAGEYRLDLLITDNSTARKLEVKLTLHNMAIAQGENPGDYISIEEL